MKYLIFFSASILLLQGCSAFEIKKEDVSEYLKKPEAISKVVFESGNYIQFNANKGNYYHSGNCIAGLADNDKFTIIPIDKISEVVTSRGIISLNKFLDADTSVVKQVKLTNGNIYTFQYLSGYGRYYKDELKIVAGFDSTSRFIKCGTDSISYFEINELDNTKTVLAGMGVVIITAAIVIYVIHYIYSSYKIGPIFGNN
jgi:hypothetical protein